MMGLPRMSGCGTIVSSESELIQRRRYRFVGARNGAVTEIVSRTGAESLAEQRSGRDRMSQLPGQGDPPLQLDEGAPDGRG